MDIELTSLAALVTANCMILFSILLFLLFCYKWDSKTYDDMADNVNDFGGHTGELFLGEAAFQIQITAKQRGKSYGSCVNSQCIKQTPR